MKKNSQIHLHIETEIYDKLKDQAKSKFVSLSELCRQKLRGSAHLDRLEILLQKLDFLLRRHEENSNLKHP